MITSFIERAGQADRRLAIIPHKERQINVSYKYLVDYLLLILVAVGSYPARARSHRMASQRMAFDKEPREIRLPEGYLWRAVRFQLFR